MIKGYGQSDAGIAAYVEKLLAPEDDVLARVRERSTAAGLPEIQLGALDALHVRVIARVSGARRAVEIGTLGGYSGICLLRGMGPEGVLHTFELDPRFAEVARASFDDAGLAARAHVHVGKALDELPKIASDGPFDLVFIDADKTSYPAYLDWAAEHLRPGGVLLADNVFAWGAIVNPPRTTFLYKAEQIEAMQRFNEALARGDRFRATILPTEEGLAVAVRV
jgi:caffeoyl-CoA O-methyltransferase